MLKALFRKQFTELFAGYFNNKKTGKRRSVKNTIGLFSLFAVLLGCLGFTFFGMANSLAKPIISVGLTWLYFAIMGLISICLGVFGSVFNTYAGLYLSKDNDLLLSMPIPPMKILFVRMSSVFSLGLLYESVVYIPTLIAFYINSPASALSVINPILTFFVIGFVILLLSCLLGWVVALLSMKLKNKTYITTILSLVFIFGYYYVCMNFSDGIQKIINETERFGSAVKSYAYPLYLMGRAAAGDWISMLIVFAASVLLVALTCFILAKTFMHITTIKNTSAKQIYKEKKVRMRSAENALFVKELRRFTSSATYMLNCGLGIVFMLAGAVMAFVMSDRLNLLAVILCDYYELFPLAIVSAVCLMASTGYIAAPSISLEGNNIWIPKTLPVNPVSVFNAKRNLNTVIILPPALILTLCADAVIGLTAVESLLSVLIVTAFVVFESACGVMLDLKFPNLTWTNETIPIKQGASVGIALFGGFFIVALIAVGGYFASKIVSVTVYMLFVLAVISAATLIIGKWLRTGGVRTFEEL